MANVIVITNQKGGVGKTTTTVNLAAYLAKSGQRVLLIDLDPQGNSTSGLGIDKNLVEKSLYDVLVKEVPLQEVRIETEASGLHLAPSSVVLAAAEVELASQIAREHRLKQAIEKVRHEYDYVLIDCPPSLGILTVNGLVGADHVLIPVQTEFYALEGLSQLLHSVQRVRVSLNPRLSLLGVLLTMYNKHTLLSRQVEAEVKKHFPNKVFDTIIPRNVRLAEAPSFGKAIYQYDRFGKGASAYKSLAKEVHIKCKT
ncbi:MAG: AAA family ATPase [Patescibacteria group bacterium]|nr:AAA family ATPase [Patescibacteria group bacterium]